MKLNLPKILDVPDKLLGLILEFEKFRYFLLKGGRGGAKSQTIARFLLYLAEKYRLRIVCGRETQNSISESVYSLFCDLIRSYDLNFEITASKIISRITGTEITFRGFREQGAFNIQGMEGIDILWIDEAQALSKHTLDVLLPTIRKENAKIIFSMNPHVFNDPVVVQMSGRDDCLTLEINFDENDKCTEALKKEARECLRRSEKDYRHIWLGEPLDQSEDALFGLEDFEISQRNAHAAVAAGYGLRVAGFDIARFGDDKCAAFIWQQMGALHWEEIFVDEWEKRDLNYTTGRILDICNTKNVDMAAIDVDGLGAGPFDTLNKGRELDYFVGFRNPAISYLENKDYGNVRTLNAYKLKNAMFDGHRRVKTAAAQTELLTLKYTFDANQRRILVSKEVMKVKYKLKSPNIADAAIMAESLIGKVKARQDRQYEPQHNINYSQDGDLFKIAGVR